MQEHRVMEMKLKASLQLLCTFICWRGSWKQLRKSKLASLDRGVSLWVLLCKGKFPCCCSVMGFQAPCSTTKDLSTLLEPSGRRNVGHLKLLKAGQCCSQ